MFPLFLEMPLTYIITGLFILISVIGFYYKPLYNALIFHPYEVFQGKRVHTLFSSAFIHTGWKHLIVNVYLFYSLARDIEYIILEKDYSIWAIKSIYIFIFFAGVAGVNLIQGLKEKENPLFTGAGASAGVFAFIGFNMLYLPLDHPKKPHKFIPLYYGYEFALAFFLILPLLIIIFKKSKTNHKAHFLGLIIGFLFAILLRPILVNEIIKHLKSRF